MMKKWQQALASLALLAAPLGVSADDGEVLRIIGADGEPTAELRHDGDDIIMSMDELMALEPTRIETETIWTTGVQVFEGVAFSDLIEHLGMEPRDVLAIAVNDYLVTIPAEDMVEGGAIIAYKHNDRMMRRRDKGPLWVVYPYDQNEEYRSEITYSRSVWQLHTLDFDSAW